MGLNALEQTQKTTCSLPTDLILVHYGTCCESALQRQGLKSPDPNHRFLLKAKICKAQCFLTALILAQTHSFQCSFVAFKAEMEAAAFCIAFSCPVMFLCKFCELISQEYRKIRKAHAISKS